MVISDLIIFFVSVVTTFIDPVVWLSALNQNEATAIYFRAMTIVLFTNISHHIILSGQLVATMYVTRHSL